MNVREATHPATDVGSLTSGRVLARSVVWNGVGIFGPMVLAIIALPVLIHCLGAARFGVLTLIWGMVRYSSYCDFGVGTALTKLLADRVGRGNSREVTSLIWTALAVIVCAGALIGVVIALLSPWLVWHVLKISADLQWETEESFYLLAFSMPFLIVSAGLRGVLAAYQRFDAINAVRGPIDVLSYACLMLSARATHNLAAIVAVLMAARFLGSALYMVLTLYLFPALRRERRPRLSDGIALLQFGGWMTISNVVNPLLSDFDRFVVGALVSVEAVAYYNTATELVSKIWQVPLLMEATWFSAFSHGYAELETSPFQSAKNSLSRLERLFSRGDALLFVVIFPISLLVAAFGHELLSVWVGVSFAARTAPILRWLAIMILVCAFAEMPVLIIQAAHKPDRTAKLRLAELPFMLPLIVGMAYWKGAEGVAIAGLIRFTIDTLAVSVIAHLIIPSAVRLWSRKVWMFAAAGLIFAAGQLFEDPKIKLFFIISTIGAFELAAWRLLLQPEDRGAVARLALTARQRAAGAFRLRPAAL